MIGGAHEAWCCMVGQWLIMVVNREFVAGYPSDFQWLRLDGSEPGIQC